jgi:hypothetical protein
MSPSTTTYVTTVRYASHLTLDGLLLLYVASSNMCLAVEQHTCTQTPKNGSGTFKTMAACNVTCVKKVTPKVLQGLWRGIQVQSNYTVGEYDFLFTTTGNVTITTPGTMANMSAGLTVLPADGADLQLLLSFNSGPDTGQFRKVIYKKGPKGPETNVTLLAMGPPFPSPDVATAPASFAAAMNGGSNQVFVLRACLADPGLACHWAGAPMEANAQTQTSLLLDENATPRARRAHAVSVDTHDVPSLRSTERSIKGPTGDPCNAMSNCSTCTSFQGGGRCGWCTAPVQYSSNNSMLGDGAVHCAGFSADGTTAEPWTCNGLYFPVDVFVSVPRVSAYQQGLHAARCFVTAVRSLGSVCARFPTKVRAWHML